MKILEQPPDPGRCWVRYALRPWPGSSELWLDLFSRGLGRDSEKEWDPVALEGLGPFDDVVYLPPVDTYREEERRRLARSLHSAGSPVLLQSLPGTQPDSTDLVQIYDVLQVVATGDLATLESIPSGTTVVWPLIGGYTDDRGLWQEGLSRLAESGVKCTLGIAADLAPVDRRRLVEVAGEHGFEKLFHGTAPAEREFAQAVNQAGMDAFLRRPLPDRSSRLVHNRQIAGLLATVGELWLRLGRKESRGQSFYRAARLVDRESHDLVVLAREGNLGVVSWLDDDSRGLIEEFGLRGETALLQELEDEYLQKSDSD